MEKFTGAKFLKQGDQGICRFKLNNMVAMDKVSFLTTVTNPIKLLQF